MPATCRWQPFGNGQDGERRTAAPPSPCGRTVSAHFLGRVFVTCARLRTSFLKVKPGEIDLQALLAVSRSDTNLSRPLRTLWTTWPITLRLHSQKSARIHPPPSPIKRLPRLSSVRSRQPSANKIPGPPRPHILLPFSLLLMALSSRHARRDLLSVTVMSSPLYSISLPQLLPTSLIQ